ncbi:MAG: site-specific integrase, partial [Bacteroidia bacterium]
MDIEVSRDSFIQHLQFEKRLSGHTLIAYSNDLSQFFKYLKTTYEIKNISDVNHTVIRSWIVSLMEQKISPRS